MTSPFPSRNSGGNGAVLDASALLALLQDEPGASRVLEALPDALMCSVNLSEVVAKLADLGMPEIDIRRALSLGLEIISFDEILAYSAGILRPTTRRAGLSLGDRACLALAQSRSLPALTTDRSWTSLDTDIDIILIRDLQP